MLDANWVGVYVGALGFCSNVDVLEELGVEAPTSWEDLLAPELKGFVAMAHPATSGTAFTAFWTIVTLEADKLEAEEEGTGYDEEGSPTEAAVDNAFEYYAALHQNILQYTRSGSAPGSLAGQGEIAVAIIFSHDCVKLQQEGYEGILTTTFPEEGTGYEIGGMGIIKGAPELEAAKCGSIGRCPRKHRRSARRSTACSFRPIPMPRSPRWRSSWVTSSS
ncbi:MAG: extracellular solute-binding protein [Chloroflexi bacterium]|nr:extracellular solute-binding protein [Chloroflexota bacterium]